MKKKNGAFSDQRKERILKKAKENGIDAIYTDGDNPKGRLNRRKVAKEAFEKIRETCREDPVVFEFNCTYGFFRNLSGGLVVDLLICLTLSILNSNYSLSMDKVVSVSAIFLGVLLVFCIICTYISAIRYAKRVYVLYDILQK